MHLKLPIALCLSAGLAAAEPLPAIQPALRFAIIADNTGGARPGVLAAAARKITLLSPDFAIGIGDLIEGGIDDADAVRAMWAEIDRDLAGLQVPFLPIPGNHDFNPGMPAQVGVWRERYGDTYRAFTHDGALFLLLNSEEEGYGRLGRTQLDFAAKVLKENASARWTFVFLHQPCWRMHRDKGWRELENLLADRPYTAFAGHTHFYERNLINGREHITLATTGGSTTNGKHGDSRGLQELPVEGRPRGPQVGEIDHLTLVTLPAGPAAQPRIALVEIDGIHASNLRDQTLDTVTVDLTSAYETWYDPLFSDETFTGGATALCLLNNANFAIRVTGSHNGGPGITCTPPTFAVEVPARTLTKVPFRVEADAAMPVSDANWRTTWTVGMASGRDTATTISNGKTLRPALRHTSLPLTAGAWPAAPSIAQLSAGGVRGFTLTCGHDDNAVRLRIEVRDPDLERQVQPGFGAERTAGVLYHDQHGRIFRHDALEIRFSGAAEPLRSRDNGWHWFRDHLMIGCYPPSDDLPALPMLSGKLPAGVQQEVVEVPGGYRVEIAIPSAWLDAQQGGRWQAYRVNVIVHDRLADGSFTRTAWQPDWRAEDTIAGSGTFFRH